MELQREVDELKKLQNTTYEEVTHIVQTLTPLGPEHFEIPEASSPITVTRKVTYEMLRSLPTVACNEQTYFQLEMAHQELQKEVNEMKEARRLCEATKKVPYEVCTSNAAVVSCVIVCCGCDDGRRTSSSRWRIRSFKRK